MSYYQLQRISNSDLTIAAHILQGIPYQKPEAAFRLGGAFHELLLEPEKFRTESCDGLDISLLYRMHRTVMSNRYCKSLLDDSEKEKTVLWDEPTTGVLCKSKLDVIHGTTVVDFKTTSARSLRAFVSCCKQYSYDRQMAFYADSIGAKQVCLIGSEQESQTTVLRPEVREQCFHHRRTTEVLLPIAAHQRTRYVRSDLLRPQQR